MNKPSIIQVVVTNGRQKYLARTLIWAKKHVSFDGLDVVGRFIIDDSGDKKYRSWLKSTYPEFLVIEVGDTPQGFHTAMDTVWATIHATTTDYVFHLEDDFIFPHNVALRDCVSILNENPYMCQVAYKRQPWFANEIKHGGMIEALEHRNIGPFKERVSKEDHLPFIEHRALWTANPCVYPKWLVTRYPWPQQDWSESIFGKELFRDSRITASYFGHKADEPACIHIGKDKLGKSY